jgi:transcriptional regulator with XRE-family HTH domain
MAAAENPVPHAALGALIRERRQELHLSMDELALRARVSRATVHRIEHGHVVVPTASKLARVISVVEITPDEVRGLLDDERYVNDILHWMTKVDAVDTMGRALRAQPHMQPLSSLPDLVVIDNDSGEVARVFGGGERLAAVLEAAGYLVTSPRVAS